MFIGVSPGKMSNDIEIIKEFLVESFENLGQLDQDLVALESEPENTEIINQIFRTVHTLKGTSGFFDFKTLEAVSHVGEDLLDSLRSSQLKVSSEIITNLLNLSDALRSILVNIDTQGTEGEETYETLKDSLIVLNTLKSENVAHEESLQNDATKELDELELAFLEAKKSYEQEACVETATTNQIVKFDNEKETVLSPSSEIKKQEITDTAIRVDINLLDKLMNLVGELVLARNQILQFTRKHSDLTLSSTSQRLNLLTTELQEGIMRTRMQPIATAWNKLPRILRDISTNCGKQVRLEMQGESTELDKTIIEAIKDPLTHIIRNAVDHGIESPENRMLKGKSPEGVLKLNAYHEGGQVIIEIKDDGAGLNTERILNKAISKGIISAEKASKISDNEIFRLIFLPGFSTSEKITNISGRGVGMDVVRSNIEKIGGSVDVLSSEHLGSTFIIKIPLTLAIIPALLVSARNKRYAIPQVNLLELLRIKEGEASEKIKNINGSSFYTLRGKLLPLVKLEYELHGEKSESKPQYLDSETINIVVVHADNNQYGLVVDQIHDTEEIVVKPLGKLLKNVNTFSGASIMGDGTIALILDLVGIAEKALITKKETSITQEEVELEIDKQKLLVFKLGENQRGAIPLEQVYRLEVFNTEQLELSAGQLAVQYRGGILPLIDLREIILGVDLTFKGKIRAFVLKQGNSYIGFIVDQVLDVISQDLKTESTITKPGISGSAIIEGAITDLIDIPSILKAAHFNHSQNEHNPLEDKCSM